MTEGTAVDVRRAELAGNLERVRERIATACADAGRSPEEVSITVVTKFFPASDARLLVELGIRDLGENRHQEAQEKADECGAIGIRWHFIGNLQSNKAAAVAAYADVVESVDRAKLLKGLSRGAHQHNKVLDVLVQVDLDPDESGRAGGRSGAAPGDVPELAERIAATEGLRLRGVMAVAPLGADPQPCFEKLAGLAGEVRGIDPGATWISAGMSGDLEAAVHAGATHVRIGSAVLGERPSLR
jgi:pyridoxal phosphate enzyme (YggS family)